MILTFVSISVNPYNCSFHFRVWSRHGGSVLFLWVEIFMPFMWSNKLWKRSESNRGYTFMYQMLQSDSAVQYGRCINWETVTQRKWFRIPNTKWLPRVAWLVRRTSDARPLNLHCVPSVLPWVKQRGASCFCLLHALSEWIHWILFKSNSFVNR